MQNGFAFEGKPAGAVRHHTRTLSFSDGLAQVRFGVQAIFTLAALRGIKRDHMVARFECFHTGTHVDHHAGSFVTEYRWKGAFGVVAAEGEGVGMADARRFDFDQYFAGLGPFEIEFDNFEGLACFKGDSGFCFHGSI